MKLRRKRYVIDPDQLDNPLVHQRDALLKREAALGVEFAARARHADSRLGGQYVTGIPRAFTSATLSQVRERKRLEARAGLRAITARGKTAPQPSGGGSPPWHPAGVGSRP